MIGKTTDQSEDQVAMGRDERQMYNLLISELPNGDFAYTVAKNFFLSHCNYLIYKALRSSTDLSLKSIADKNLTELSYHLEYFDQWVIRLGDGTELSHDKMQAAIDELWDYTGEFYTPVDYEQELDKKEFPINLDTIKADWTQSVDAVLSEATLTRPGSDWSQKGGKTGVHTEHMGYILGELRYMQLSYPDLKW